MKPIIYHTGITHPPEIHTHLFEVVHTPTISVEFNHHHIPQDISEFLKSNPVAIMMSKNAVSGLKNWLEKYNLAMDFFGETQFWTVGEQTHQHLMDELGVESWHPELMTGEGIIQSLVEKHQSRILLISAHVPRKSFIDGLDSAKIHFFHFPVYATHILSNTEFATQFTDNVNNILVCTSPSTLNGIMRSLSIPSLADLKTKLVSIGPTTSNAIRESGGVVYHESNEQKISNLYSEIIKVDFCHERS
ncbi:MAG: uroporphyrinogen-III synthase [Candidatus Marinimicrobia bacterium]|nr:uroporphyrinogen-III synthase [Candidatus Neomarinimicrobiota bacterium]